MYILHGPTKQLATWWSMQLWRLSQTLALEGVSLQTVARFSDTYELLYKCTTYHRWFLLQLIHQQTAQPQRQRPMTGSSNFCDTSGSISSPTVLWPTNWPQKLTAEIDRRNWPQKGALQVSLHRGHAGSKRLLGACNRRIFITDAVVLVRQVLAAHPSRGVAEMHRQRRWQPVWDHASSSSLWAG